MTPDQLAAARATHWHQDARPLLTLEDATTWIEQMQLALYLPRKTHVLAPAPSFVEAVAGQGNATPAPDAIAGAGELLVRLVQEGTVVPLNLFGTPGEQPDFLVAAAALPHLAALQADRNWKKPPSRTGPGKVSPMAIEVWKLLHREGALTAGEIREQLGHELTEAATIRGLSELWQNMRVAPLPAGAGQPAHWQLLSVTHKKEMAAGGTMSQSAALSMLVSNYLQSIITGTAEDIEAFLSPVASRSRLRDVVRGLTATRQLRTLSMDAQTFLFIEGTLPEMPEVVAADAADADAKPAFMGRSAYRERMLNRGKEENPETGADQIDKAEPRRERPAFRPSARPDRPQRFAAGGGSTFRKRPASFTDRPGAGRPNADRPYADRPSSGRPGAGRPSFSRPGTDRPGTDRSGTDRSGTDRSGFSRPRFGSAFGAGRPGAGRSSGDRTGSDRPRSGPGKFASGDRPRTGRPFSKPGERDASRSRPGSDRSQDRPRFGARPPFRPGGADRGADRGEARSADRGSRPFPPRAGSDRPPREARPLRSSEGSAPDSRNSSRAGFQSRTGGRPGRPAGDRPRPDRSAGDRPSSGRPRPPRAEGDRPFTPRLRTEGGDSRPPRRFDDKPSFQRRDSRSPGGRPSGRPSSSRPSSSRPSSSRPSSSRRSGGRPPSDDSRAPRREGSSSGYPSNPNRPSRAPRPSGTFAHREGGSDRRPGSNRTGPGRPGSGDRPPARGGRPGFASRPGAGDRGRSGASGRPPGGAPGRTPGRNPGGTGRPGGPRTGGARPFGAGGSRPSGPRTGPSRPGGMKPPARKPRPEKDSE